jgi:hypothetical protein
MLLLSAQGFTQDVDRLKKRTEPTSMIQVESIIQKLDRLTRSTRLLAVVGALITGGAWYLVLLLLWQSESRSSARNETLIESLVLLSSP